MKGRLVYGVCIFRPSTKELQGTFLVFCILSPNSELQRYNFGSVLISQGTREN